GAGLRARLWARMAERASIPALREGDGDVRKTPPVRGRAGRRSEGPVRDREPRDDGRHFAPPGRYDCRHRPGPAGVGSGGRSFRQNKMTGGTGGMKKDEPRQHLGGPRGEGGDPAEERMEDWYQGGVTEFGEGEVVRGRVVHIGSS